MAKEKTEAKLDAKLQKILDSVAELSVMELSQLVKALEEKFDVQAVAAAPVATTTVASESAGTSDMQEKSEFQVIITNAGTNKIAVIKAVRTYKQELGLKEAKDMIDACPADLGVMKKDQADEAKKLLEKAGAQVELK